MPKQYLKDHDRAYTTGAWLRWDEGEKCFRFDGLDESAYYDGKNVEFDENNRAYIESK